MSAAGLHIGTLAERLKKILLEQIADGTFPAGSRLPTEEQCALQHGVSRSVVRETFASLRSDGIIRTRQGQGATVAGGMNAVPFRIAPDSLVTQQAVVEVFELRLAVESEAAGLAAQRSNAAQRKAIGNALRALEHAGERGDDGVEEDFGFHRAIVDGSNNSRYREFVDFLGWKIRDQATITRHKSEIAHRMDLLRIEHTAIYDAIMRRDADAARTAARVHFQNGIQRFLKPNA